MNVMPTSAELQYGPLATYNGLIKRLRLALPLLKHEEYTPERYGFE